MKIIVLDQNAISNLAFLPDQDWADILKLLRTAVKNGLAICPTAPETISESTHMSQPERQRILEVSRQLSNGCFMQFIWEIIAQEFLAQVRPGFEIEYFRHPPNPINAESDIENAPDRQAIEKEKHGLETVLNEERPTPQRNKEFTVADAIYMWTISWLKLVRSHLNKLRNGQILGGDQFIIQQMCGTLVRLDITDQEITGLLANIRDGRWMEIRLLSALLMLDGLILFDQVQRGRRFKYNDEWDKYRASTAYHVADCFITDRGMASMLRQLKLPEEDVFEVLSVGEVSKIVSYLKGLAA